MSIFIAPALVLTVALIFSGRIVWLKGQGRQVSRTLESGRYVCWTAFGFSALLACFQAGVV